MMANAAARLKAAVSAAWNAKPLSSAFAEANRLKKDNTAKMIARPASPSVICFGVDSCSIAILSSENCGTGPASPTNVERDQKS
jgi:hypothetical protein